MLDSEELQKKIKDYFFWRDQLPILKKEIEDILGKSIDDAAAPAESKRGRKKGGTSVSDDQIEQEVIDVLAKSATLGQAAAGIAGEISGKFTDVAKSTIYQKVSRVLKRGEGHQFRKTGELINTKWFGVQK